MMGDEVATLLSASVVEAVRMCDPFEDKPVFQEMVYGAEVRRDPRGAPSRRN